MLTKKIKRIVQLGLISLLSIGLVISLGYWLGMAEIETAVAAPVKAPLADTCWATIDGVTVYSDTTSSPVQTAVNAASPNDIIKIAGTCVGVQLTSGTTQTVYISESVTLQGGYTETDWMAAPDSIAYPTLLDAAWNGRVVYIPDGYTVTLSSLTLSHGKPPDSGDNVGGGLYVANSAAIINNSTFYSNTAVDGGGIHNASGTVTVTSSTFYSNTAVRGAALYANGNTDAFIENSTFAYGNATEGGGIHNRGALTVTYSTFAENIATGVGDAIHTWNGTMSLYATIMSNSNGEEDCEPGTLIASVETMITDGSCSATYAVDPLLSPLGNYGGDTLTFALPLDSPAVDKISAGATGCGTTVQQDQRGVTRPFEANCDIGSYESNEVIAFDDTYATGENAILTVTETVGVLANDRMGGGVVTAVLSSTTSNGSLDFVSTGAFTYTPDLDICGVDSFTYYANNGSDDSNVATVDIIVFGCPVTAVDDAYTATEDTPFTITATGVLSNDISGIYAYPLTQPANGAVALAIDGGFTYTPDLDFNGEDTWTYYAAGSIPVPVAHWPFDDGVNPTSDVTGLGFDATINSSVTFTTEVPAMLGGGQSLNFDDGNGAVYSGGDSEALELQTFTAAFWVNIDVDTIGDYAKFLGKSVAWGVERYESIGGRVVFYTNGPSNYQLTSSTAIDDGQWHHVAVSYDGSTKSIYIDGVLDTSIGATGSIGYFNNNPLQIGGDNFDGRLDDVRLYRTVLSLSEVQAAMADSMPTNIDTATVTMTVTSINDPVIANDDWYIGSLNETLTVSASGVLENDVDMDDSVLNAVVATLPAVGSLTLNADGSFAYTPPMNATGPITYTYIASDGFLTDTATVTMTFGVDTCYAYLNSSGQEYSNPTGYAIELALADAQEDDLIKIAGYCVNPIGTGGNGRSISLTQNITLQGGYTNTNWLTASNPALYPTTLDANNKSRVINIASSAVTLDGLIVTGGYITGSTTIADGGGMHIAADSNVVIENSLITHNFAKDDGGGIYVDGGSLVTIDRSQIISNTTDDDGAGMRVYSGTVTISDSAINDNFANDDGGGLQINSNTAVTITRSSIDNNISNDDGGGIETSGDLWLLDSTLNENTGEDRGAIDGDGGGPGGAIVIIIANTVISGNLSLGSGGSIDNDGFMYISDSLIQNNRVLDDDGGAIDNSDTLIITDTQIIGNYASDDCGGIYNSNTMTLTRVTIEGNEADNGGGLCVRHGDSAVISESSIANNIASVNGGGIYLSNSSSLTLTNSMVYSNTAVQAGGLYNDGGTAVIANSTISGNWADQDSAIMQDGTTSVMALAHTTLVSNTAAITDTAIGIYSGTLTISNSIVAHNGALNCALSGGVFISDGYNLEDGDSCGLNAAGDITNTNPMLGPIANNGGNTWTHALLVGSPAINAGDPAYAVLTGDYDQRGVGYARVVNGRLDIGAYESGSFLLTVNISGTGSGTVTSSPSGIDCGSDCSYPYAGVVVTLTAVSDAGSTFTGWSGDCSGTDVCVVTMTAAQNVMATFDESQFYIFLPVILK